MLNRKSYSNWMALIFFAMLVACATPTLEPTPAPTATPALSALEKIIQAAKKEGTLNLIAAPREWCGYGALIENFKTLYGLQVNELNPEAGSLEQLDAIKTSKSPDVIDVRHQFGPVAQQEGLLQTYKVSTWDSIPSDQKDAAGFWYGNYYGVMIFQINTDIVKNPPQDWNDLLKPEYKAHIALAGDPRSSHQAMMSVYAAGLASGATPENAGQAGLDFFAKLKQAGNMVPIAGQAATLASGGTPIVLRWDYLAAMERAALKDNPRIALIVPKSGALAGMYVSAISAFAPHPNAAKLWLEYLYSDDGQLAILKSSCRPIRLNDLLQNKKIPADALAPANAIFSALDHQTSQREIIVKNWEKIVGVNVR